MIEKNWRAIGLTLLAANLVFMALLEWQRRTIWQGERDYFARIEQSIKTTDKSQASYDLLAKQLSDINARLAGIDARVNDVEIMVQNLVGSRLTGIDDRINNLQMKVQNVIDPRLAGIDDRVNNLQMKVQNVVDPRLASIDDRVNNVEINVKEGPASAALTREILARVNALQIAVGEISAAKR